MIPHGLIPRLILLVLGLGGGVNGAFKTLTQRCTPDDICIGANLNLKCDRITKSCKLAVGQKCAGLGHAVVTACVTGAVCSTEINVDLSNMFEPATIEALQRGTCQCTGTENDISAPGYCMAEHGEFGGTCYSGDTCTGTLVCDEGYCKCSSSSANNPFDTACSLRDEAGSGSACFAVTECGSPLMVCSSGICQCASGFFGLIGKTECVKTETAGSPGESCTENEDCGSPDLHLMCQDSICTCDDNYFAVPGSKCFPDPANLGSGQCVAMKPWERGTCGEGDVCDATSQCVRKTTTSKPTSTTASSASKAGSGTTESDKRRSTTESAKRRSTTESAKRRSTTESAKRRNYSGEVSVLPSQLTLTISVLLAFWLRDGR